MLLKWCQDDLPVEVEETFGEKKKEREASITTSSENKQPLDSLRCFYCGGKP